MFSNRIFMHIYDNRLYKNTSSLSGLNYLLLLVLILCCPQQLTCFCGPVFLCKKRKKKTGVLPTSSMACMHFVLGIILLETKECRRKKKSIEGNTGRGLYFLLSWGPGVDVSHCFMVKFSLCIFYFVHDSLYSGNRIF